MTTHNAHVIATCHRSFKAASELDEVIARRVNADDYEEGECAPIEDMIARWSDRAERCADAIDEDFRAERLEAQTDAPLPAAASGN